MNILRFALVLFFIFGNVYAEAMNKTLNPISAPMSSYLTGPYGKLQSASFLGLALCMLLLIPLHAGLPWLISLIVCAASIIVVVATKWLMLSQPSEAATLERIHVISAGLAFVCATLAETDYFLHSPWLWLALAAPISAVLWNRFAPQQTALEEKSYALCVTASLVRITGIALFSWLVL
ncbi:MAG: hypothetical protein WBR15_02745 [Gammaproteobacteria bacterium]